MAKALTVIEMKQTLFIIITIGVLGCRSSQQKVELTSDNCDNTKLVNYVYPIKNFVKENTLVYSLKSNRESASGFFKKSHQLKISKDTLLLSVKKDSEGKTVDSTIFSLKNGIPKVLKSFTGVNFYPNLIRTKDTIIGNEFCEFATFGNIFEYKIPTENGPIIRKFEGHTTHKKYVKKEFRGIQYNCIILESEKTLTVEFNGRTEKLKGTWSGCTCEDIGEIYSTTKTEDGLVIEHKLEEVIVK